MQLYCMCIQVKIGFLPVGHTHEDIDQLFSCISRHLHHKNAITIPGKLIYSPLIPLLFLMAFISELTKAIQFSFSPKPKVVVLESVADAKAWMHNQTMPLHDHLKAHQFKFLRTEHGTRMFYKEWSSDSFWLPDMGLDILPTESRHPLGEPLRISPYYDPDNIQKLEATLRKVSTLTFYFHFNPLDWCRLKHT